jgi:sucrose-6-phosphate hydrolase SacC (GH32 family)
MSRENELCYPILHFAPTYGWMNDPNGLVYHDGIYELFYQANPNGVEWDDMTWGHARSTDLIHWEEMTPALFPDENGMMYSGCGLKNDREELDLPAYALLFPYTAAKFRDGFDDPEFTIRLAYSIDGGKTLIKKEGKLLDEVAPDNRDPKVFWHEESKAYILVLWIEKNDFGIWRSEDMTYFSLVQRITLEGGFECPDLFELPVMGDDGNICGKKWVFWTADGSYFVGNFDGYKFIPTQEKRFAYWITRVPYAAQTWSGDPKGRVLQIPWLRTKCVADQTTGAMGVPRKLTLKEVGDSFILKHELPEEIYGATQPISELKAGESSYISGDGALFMRLDKLDGCEFKLYENGENEPFVTFSYNKRTGNVVISDGKVSEFLYIGRSYPGEACIIYDRGIVELTAMDDTLLQMTDLPHLRGVKTGRLSFDKGTGILKLGIIM